METNIIKKSLLELGLSEMGASVYISALNHKNKTIVEIAKDLNIERPTVYAALKKLKNKGLVLETKKPFSRGVNVESPDKIIELLKRKQSTITKYELDLKEILPDLMSEYHAKKGFQKVKFYQGQDEFIAILDKILDEVGEEVLYLGSAHSFIEFIGTDYEQDWIKRRVKRNIYMKVLVFSSDLVRRIRKDDKENLRQLKFLPIEYNFDGSYHVFGNKIIIWNPIIPRAIVIEDPIYAKMFKKIFYIIWNIIE